MPPLLASLPGLTAFNHGVVKQALLSLACKPEHTGLPAPAFLTVDATCGNGHDTLFLTSLAELLPEQADYRVLAFDVQAEALGSAQEALMQSRAHTPGARHAPVEFLLQSHSELGAVLQQAVGQEHAEPSRLVCAVMYNLGFLPRSDKRIITAASTTLPSLAAAAHWLVPGGILSVHCYAGHAGGEEERQAVHEFFTALPPKEWHTIRFESPNKTRNPEALYLAEKRKKKRPGKTATAP